MSANEASEHRTSSARKQSASTSAPPPPSPSFILRGHEATVTALEFFASNTFLVSGDESGWVCIWDIWKRRQVYKWHGHPSGPILALKPIPYKMHPPEPRGKLCASSIRQLGENQEQEQEQEQVYIASHGRDNEIHVWDVNTILQRSLRLSGRARTHGAAMDQERLTPVFSLPVNAMNFCGMSILAVETTTQSQQQQMREKGHDREPSSKSDPSSLSKTHRHIYLAVPSPTTSTLIDVYDIVKPERTFASVGYDNNSGNGNELDRKWGSVMAIQLFRKKVVSLDRLTLEGGSEPDLDIGTLHMLAGYEDGSVMLFQENIPVSVSTGQQLSGQTLKQKRKMDALWSIKCHRQPVLALDISSDLSFAVSTGTDNILAKYDLFSQVQGVPEVTKVALKSNGITGTKIRKDDKIIGMAGWDGRVRIYSSKTMKPLAVLKYHRERLDCLDFAAVQDREHPIEGSVTEQRNSLLSYEASSSASIQSSDISRAESNQSVDSESSSGEDSDMEDAYEERRQWSRRHWIAVGGKEHRISLWEIY
ncbi:MAG: WD40-repeat-containing domain protein [Benniella sp.]|nr:MAG: WD40-repeat-containing domain protein [Benniella sp.]